SLSYAYQWQKQAGGIGSFTNVGTNSATLSGPFTRGDVYQVVATANDGHGGTASATSGTVSIGNSAPVAGSVAVSPREPTSSSATLTATPSGFTDAESDSLSYA